MIVIVTDRTEATANADSGGGWGRQLTNKNITNDKPEEDSLIQSYKLLSLNKKQRTQQTAEPLMLVFLNKVIYRCEGGCGVGV